MRRMTTRWMAAVCVACVTLTFAVQAWGRVQPRAAMLAYTAYDPETGYLLAVYDPAMGLTLRVDERSTALMTPAWSDDGRLAFASYHRTDSDIYLWDENGVTNLTQTPVINEGLPDWSADGRLVFTGFNDHYNQAFLWDGTVVEALAVGIATNDAVWSSDGRMAYASVRDVTSNIYVWDSTDEQNISQSTTSYNSNPLWSDDGRLLYMANYGSYMQVMVWDGVSNQVILDVSATTTLTGTSWSDDGRIVIGVVYMDGSTQVLVWDGTALTDLVPPGGINIFASAWSANGRLAMSADDGTNYDIWVWDGVVFSNITQTPLRDEYQPHWSDDGRLAFGCVPVNTNAADICLWDNGRIYNVTHSPTVIENNLVWWTP